MTYTKEFNSRVKKLNRKHRTCLNYLFRLSSQSLTEGFWWHHGYDFDDQLTTLKEKFTEEWKHYCEENGLNWEARVDDWMC